MLFAAFACARFANESASLLLLGMYGLLVWVGDDPLTQTITLGLRGLMRWLAGVALISLLLLLPLETASIAATWPPGMGMLQMVAWHTAYGQAWLLRAGLTLVLLLAAWRGVSARWLLLWAVLQLAPLALSGHAAMQEGVPGWVHRVNHVLHLCCAGFWLGSMLVFLRYMAAVAIPAQRPLAIHALQRFSGAGHVAVAGVLLTGCINTALVLPQLPLPGASAWQSLLWLKVLVTGWMLGIAVVNRYRRVPRHEYAAVCRQTRLEIGLGLVALGLVAVLGLLSPV